jgi:hypothetical protein
MAVRTVLEVGYFDFGGLASFTPVTKSQSMKAHHITSRRSRRTAVFVTGFTNKSTGVKIRSRVPDTNFTLNL